ncbi:Transposase Tc1-like [Trinorchestia longiramus]|nr:Transposase Tc1-like [Trinorchestia longiramus]
MERRENSSMEGYGNKREQFDGRLWKEEDTVRWKVMERRENSSMEGYGKKREQFDGRLWKQEDTVRWKVMERRENSSMEGYGNKRILFDGRLWKEERTVRWKVMETRGYCSMEDARRRKVRLTEVEDLVKEAIASTVSAALRQELEPLHTALRIVKLDTFTEGIVRQLSTLEHIQTVHIGSLDAKVAALVKDSHNVKMSEAGASGSSGSTRSSDSNSCSRTEELKAVLMQASAAFSARLTATERRVKDDLGTLESRLSETVKRSQLALDSRLSSISADTSLILNKTCRDNDPGGEKENLVNETPGQSLRFPFSSGLPLGSSYPNQRSFPSPSLSRSHSSKTRGVSLFDQGGTLNESPSSSGPQADHTTESLTLLPFPSWGRAEMVNLAVVSRLAAEIATRISRDTLAPPRDCADIAALGETESGVYVIHPAVCSARVTLKVSDASGCEHPRLGTPALGEHEDYSHGKRESYSQVVQRPQTICKELKDYLKASGIKVSKHTISRALRREGLRSRTPHRIPLLQKRHVKARLKYANDHLNKPATI